MKLIGLYDSPFVRRAAVTLRVLGLPYEHVPLSAFRHAEALAQYNPALKAPVLVLDDGTTLTESSFIVDYLDELASTSTSTAVPHARLLPAAGAARLAALRTIAIALVAAEKSVALNVETRMRPEALHHAPLIERAQRQIVNTLAALEAGPLPEAGAALDQVAITLTCVWTFIAKYFPDLTADHYPRLAALAARCEAEPAFVQTAPQ